MAAHQRCWVEKMRKIVDKVPKKVLEEVLDALRTMYRAKSYKEVLGLRAAFIRCYGHSYPKAVESLLQAGEALFTYMRLPKYQWVQLKTTNPTASLFATVRLRTRAARRLRTRMGTVCLVFQLLRNGEPRLRRIGGFTLVPDVIDQLFSQQTKRQKAA